jgi:hypothetical protein
VVGWEMGRRRRKKRREKKYGRFNNMMFYRSLI